MGSVGSQRYMLYSENAQTLNGRPGTYTLFRSGDLSAPNGMIFLATQESEAEYYGAAERDLDVYNLDIKNPLVIDAQSDVQAVQEAWKRLHPGQDLSLGRAGTLTDKKWQQLDKQNSTALKKSDYDAVVYKVGGKVKEVQIPRQDSNRLNKVTTKQHPGTITVQDTLNKARTIVNQGASDKTAMANKVVKGLSNSTYEAQYIPHMNMIAVQRKTGTALEKSRSQVFYEIIQSASGKYFVRRRI